MVLRLLWALVLLAHGAAVEAADSPPDPIWRGELSAVMPWCALRTGQPTPGAWCKVQGDAFPSLPDWKHARYEFAPNGVWVGTRLTNGVLCMPTSEYTIFLCF